MTPLRVAAAVPQLAPGGAAAPDILRLPGGRAVLLRAITAADAAAEQRFVGALSLDSRHKRFHVGLHQLTPELLRRMTDVDQQRHVALVAQEVGGDESAQPRLVADARYVLPDGQTDEAEFAIAVADDWQSLGLGRTLMARLAAHAKRQGLRALFGDVLVQNRRMLVLMRGLGAVARRHPDGPQLTRLYFDLD
jgi:acetyltransferase